MIGFLFAVAFTFTATATGVEKGTPLEFFLAGTETDRGYETLFVLDETIESFCNRIEKAGIPRGCACDYKSCNLWPVGVSLQLEPDIRSFVDIDIPKEISLGDLIYTGGIRLNNGMTEAGQNMPMAVFSLYTLAQSPLLFDGIYPQGEMYGSFKAKFSLKKGEKHSFTLTWNGNQPRHVSLDLHPDNLSNQLSRLKDISKDCNVVVSVNFSNDLTVDEAIAVAQALAVLDSPRIKINGRNKKDFYFRAFLPLSSWRDRKERLVQPFEITLGSSDKITYINEDWSVEGTDPLLTEVFISYEDMSKFPKTDTAFFFVKRSEKLQKIKNSLKKLPDSVVNHYVYVD